MELSLPEDIEEFKLLIIMMISKMHTITTHTGEILTAGVIDPIEAADIRTIITIIIDYKLCKRNQE